MSKRQLLCLLGAWVMLFLFLGLPSGWHKAIAVISGLLVIVVAYNLPAPAAPKSPEAKEVFEENNQPR